MKLLNISDQNTAATKIQSLVRAVKVRENLAIQKGKIPAQSFVNVAKSLSKEDFEIPSESFVNVANNLLESDRSTENSKKSNKILRFSV